MKSEQLIIQLLRVKEKYKYKQCCTGEVNIPHMIDDVVSEINRLTSKNAHDEHYIELGKAIEYAVQNEIRFIRQMTNGEKYAFIDKYDKAKLLKIFNEMVEENKNMKACIYRAQAQGGEFNE